MMTYIASDAFYPIINRLIAVTEDNTLHGTIDDSLDLTNMEDMAHWHALLQVDGNLVLYDKEAIADSNVYWATNTGGVGAYSHQLILQTNGNLDLLDGDNVLLWQAKNPNPVANMTYKAFVRYVDGALVVQDRNNQTIWCSCDHPWQKPATPTGTVSSTTTSTTATMTMRTTTTMNHGPMSHSMPTTTKTSIKTTYLTTQTTKPPPPTTIPPRRTTTTTTTTRPLPTTTTMTQGGGARCATRIKKLEKERNAQIKASASMAKTLGKAALELSKNLEDCRRSFDTPVPPTDHSTPFPHIPANSPLSNTQPRCPFPDEILWDIFTYYLRATSWKGWTSLLLLDRRIHTALMTSTLLIRRTLPPAYGGVFPTILHLLSKLERARDTRKSGMTQVLNGVMSAIRYTENDDWNQIRNFQRRVPKCRSSPYVALFLLARSSFDQYGPYVGTYYLDWATVARYMGSIRGSQPKEYERFKTSLIEIFNRYNPESYPQYFTKDFLITCYGLRDPAFFEDMARIGGYTAKEVKDCVDHCEKRAK
ncbi:hypothetical protein HDV00_007367 [Rhizophlyctis rosea]|nr:hypothetical protein HDV00_007367 [Rhizophlyctis rosea]